MSGTETALAALSLVSLALCGIACRGWLNALATVKQWRDEVEKVRVQRFKALAKAHHVLRQQREERHETRVNLFAQLRREIGLQ